MEIVKIYIAEAKRLYLKDCIDKNKEPDKEVMKKFDELIKGE